MNTDLQGNELLGSGLYQEVKLNGEGSAGGNGMVSGSVVGGMRKSRTNFVTS